MLPDSSAYLIIAGQCSFSMCRIRLSEAANLLLNMGVRREGKPSCILKFYICLLHFQQKRSFSQFREGKMKFHFWPSLAKILPTPMLLKSAFSTFCHREFVYDTGSVYFTYNFMLHTLQNQAVQRVLSNGAPLFILPSQFYKMTVLHCSQLPLVRKSFPHICERRLQVHYQTLVNRCQTQGCQ